ncbi:MAG: hypothetical protein EBZ48_00600, partial [Proteobacteria bacterium]|nr:hypothetical protein [Pseudomonadota bacterium]
EAPGPEGRLPEVLSLLGEMPRNQTADRPNGSIRARAEFEKTTWTLKLSNISKIKFFLDEGPSPQEIRAAKDRAKRLRQLKDGKDSPTPPPSTEESSGGPS